MEWSSDGYVLAVAWRHGWGIITVGGRCLVSCFGVEDMVDEDKFQDAFMYGAKHLVSTIPCLGKIDLSDLCFVELTKLPSFGHQAILNCSF